MQIQAFILDTAPETFTKYIVNGSAASVHADTNVLVLQNAREQWAGELCALVSIEDFWRSIALQCLCKRLPTKRAFHTVGQAP